MGARVLLLALKVVANTRVQRLHHCAKLRALRQVGEFARVEVAQAGLGLEWKGVLAISTRLVTFAAC